MRRRSIRPVADQSAKRRSSVHASAAVRSRQSPLAPQMGTPWLNSSKRILDPRATVYTDDAAAYNALPACYQYEAVKHSAGEYVRGAVSTNSIESVWAMFKRSVNGTWHHVSKKHMGRYVNEAAFRLNEGNCEMDTIDRMTELAKRVGGRRLSYRTLIRG